jgi:GxxExxY protein
MHALFTKADGLTGEVIGAAIEVHRIMGPGLLESIYERCLLRELFNFHEIKLVDGISRLILPCANISGN